MHALRPALLLFAAMTAAVAVLQLLPRPGGAVAVIYPPGVSAGMALPGLLEARPGWLPLRLAEGLVTVIYADPAADPAPGRPPGALFLVAARTQPGCAPQRTRT
ncbi:hypothetical protein ACQW02_04305 [Humitalea sp. 24SJ18S-53]|uniref:hypothetical protein n=1 Tax=Humitalea sp. 24SJ18S-53 TaxID=3422307 RepID=UPI003D670A3F